MTLKTMEEMYKDAVVHNDMMYYSKKGLYTIGNSKDFSNYIRSEEVIKTEKDTKLWKILKQLL